MAAMAIPPRLTQSQFGYGGWVCHVWAMARRLRNWSGPVAFEQRAEVAARRFAEGFYRNQVIGPPIGQLLVFKACGDRVVEHPFPRTGGDVFLVDGGLFAGQRHPLILPQNDHGAALGISPVVTDRSVHKNT